MDHAQGAELELVGVAARAEVLRAKVDVTRAGLGALLRLAALAVFGEADDVFHQ